MDAVGRVRVGEARPEPIQLGKSSHGGDRAEEQRRSVEGATNLFFSFVESGNLPMIFCLQSFVTMKAITRFQPARLQSGRKRLCFEAFCLMGEGLISHSGRPEQYFLILLQDCRTHETA